MKYKLKACVLAGLVGLMAASCDSYKDSDNPDKIVEADKDLSGVWQLTEVKRNGIDISEHYDFGRFKLHLDKNGRYMLENRLPFPVTEDGAWQIDDPAHPFMITFTEDDVTGDPTKVEISFPNVHGERQLGIKHSPGCGSNIYQYVFVKTN